MADNAEQSDSTTLLATAGGSAPSIATPVERYAITTPALEDAGLHCLRCEYNLTGIDSSRCPECGLELDWEAIRRSAEIERGLHGTRWERSAWIALPLALVTTTLDVALTPWIFAKQIGNRHRIWPAVGFAVVCMAIGMFGIRLLWSGEIIEPLWSASVLFHVLIQTLLLAWLLRPQLIHKPLRFWFIVSLYTTYPVLLESLTGPPFIIYGHSNIWPLALIWYQPGSWVTTAPSYFNSIIYYLWMAGLIVIAYQRLPHRRRWHSLWLIALLPVITIASAYSARYVIDGIDWFIG